MTTTRSLLRGARECPLNRIRDPHERIRIIEQVAMQGRLSDDDAEHVADRLTMFERTILEMEMTERRRMGHTSDYEPFDQAWKI